MDAEEHRSTTVFREYLRIKSIQPEPDYGKLKSSLYFEYEWEVQIQRKKCHGVWMVVPCACMEKASFEFFWNMLLMRLLKVGLLRIEICNVWNQFCVK